MTDAFLVELAGNSPASDVLTSLMNYRLRPFGVSLLEKLKAAKTLLKRSPIILVDPGRTATGPKQPDDMTSAKVYQISTC